MRREFFLKREKMRCVLMMFNMCDFLVLKCVHIQWIFAISLILVVFSQRYFSWLWNSWRIIKKLLGFVCYVKELLLMRFVGWVLTLDRALVWIHNIDYTWQVLYPVKLMDWMGVTWQQSISHDHKFGILFDVLKGCFFISFSDFWCHFVQFLSLLNDVQAWYCPAAARATPHSFCLTFSQIIHPFKVFFNWSQVFRKHWLGWLDLAVFWQLLHFFSPSPISTA